MDKSSYMVIEVSLGRNCQKISGKKLSELFDRGEKIKQIAMTDKLGWVILYENGAVWDRIPDSNIDAIRQLYDRGEKVKWTGFTPDLDWVILYGRNGYWYHGIP